MNEILASISYILGIVLSCSAIVNYIVIKPLRISIEALKTSVDGVQLTLTDLTKSNRALENRIIICEQNFNHYEKRLSKVEDFIFNKEA